MTIATGKHQQQQQQPLDGGQKKLASRLFSRNRTIELRQAHAASVQCGKHSKILDSDLASTTTDEDEVSTICSQQTQRIINSSKTHPRQQQQLQQQNRRRLLQRAPTTGTTKTTATKTETSSNTQQQQPQQPQQPQVDQNHVVPSRRLKRTPTHLDIQEQQASCDKKTLAKKKKSLRSNRNKNVEDQQEEQRQEDRRAQFRRLKLHKKIESGWPRRRRRQRLHVSLEDSRSASVQLGFAASLWVCVWQLLGIQRAGGSGSGINAGWWWWSVVIENYLLTSAPLAEYALLAAFVVSLGLTTHRLVLHPMAHDLYVTVYYPLWEKYVKLPWLRIQLGMDRQYLIWTTALTMSMIKRYRRDELRAAVEADKKRQKQKARFGRGSTVCASKQRHPQQRQNKKHVHHVTPPQNNERDNCDNNQPPGPGHIKRRNHVCASQQQQ